MAGQISNAETEYDLMQVVMVYVGSSADGIEDDLLRMLHLIFRARRKAEEKMQRLRDEFDIVLDNKMRKELNIMCNLSEGIAEEARAEAWKEAWGEAWGEAWEEATLKNLHSLVKTAKVSIEQALDMLEVPATERPRYIELLGQ